MGRSTRIAIVGICISACRLAVGATWHVDGSVHLSGDGSSWQSAFKTIQEGIDAASHGDTVIAAQGTYVENIHFHGKNIVLRSTRPEDASIVSSTILDGGGTGPVASFTGLESEACVLSGFTIRNGRAWNGGGICGGTHATDTLATIENNVIAGNHAERYGGGILRCDGLIENNTISENSCMLGGPWGGGGLCDCDGTVQNNTITGNSADRGGGLAYCNATIQNNVITGNSAPGYHSEGGGLVFCGGTIRNNTISCNSASACGGGLMWCDGPIQDNSISGNSAAFGGGLYSCDGTIENNLIAGNSAKYHGGGLDSCSGTIRNNTISGNSARFHGGGLHGCDGAIQDNTIPGNSADFGGGLYECDDTIRNNIVVDNSAGSFGGGLYRCNGATQNNTIARNSAGRKGGGLYDCRATIRNCIIWGNTAPKGPQVYGLGGPTYSCIEDWAAGGEGNTSQDPRFADPDGPDDDPGTYQDNNYCLAEGSPCVDAGKNEDWMWRAVDVDHRPRILYGDSSLTVDMGAYEYWPRQLIQCHPERAEMNYCTGTFSVPVSVMSFPDPLPPTVSIWLVVRSIVFPVSGAKSEGMLWNADGIASEAYPGSGDYCYEDITDYLAPDSGAPCEVVLEFYIKDRNPTFEPAIELWAFRPDVGQQVASTVPMVPQGRLRIEHVTSLAGGAILLQWASQEGGVYVVEASGRPGGPWRAVSDEILPERGRMEWVDRSAVGVDCRFYRIRGTSR